MMNSYIIECTECEKKLVLTGEWSPALTEMVASDAFDAIEMNCGKGWVSTVNYSFLPSSKRVKSLSILDAKAEDVSGVACFPNIERLNLNVYSGVGPILSRFSRLKELKLQWKKWCGDLSECSNIEDLYVSDFAHKEGVRALPKTVRRMHLARPKVANLDEIWVLSSLVELELSMLKSDDYSFLNGLPELRKLVLTGCRGLGSIEWVRGLRKLEVLGVNDCGSIDCIAPIASLSVLRELYFFGQTIINDGDLRCIENMNLRKLSFGDRRHYSNSLKSLKQSLGIVG